MIPILYNTITEGTVPTDFGLGPLTDCLKAEVKEERNGAYELTLSYASDGIHAEDIQVNRFIMAKPNYTDSAQIFRIYKVGKAINGRFEVSAQHVAYDLSGKVISTGSASSCVAACTLLTAQAGSFTINTDKTVSASFKITEPSSVRSWFGGKAGSLLDVYGGEWAYNNYTATLKQARGTDRGVTIRFGKNLTEINQEVSIENLVTGIIPFYIDTDGNKTVGSKVNTGLVLDVPRDLAIDFSQDVDPESGTAIATQLANLANKYITNNDLTNPLNSITLNFVQLEGLTERVDLCDTVHIYYEPLGITATAKCIATVWDVLEERYTQTTFGSPKTNIADTIATQAREVAQAPSTSFMNEAIAHATELITGNLGGYVILHDSNGDGYPDEILIMNTADISTATQVWRWNKNGLGYATSYAGPYGTAITQAGKIVADYVATGTLDASKITVQHLSASSIDTGAMNASLITTGTLNANIIKAGTISDTQGNSSINMTTGAAILNDLKAKNSLILVDNTNTQRGSLSYSSAGGTLLNMSNPNGTTLCSLQARATGSGGNFQIFNNSGTNVLVAQANAAGGGYYVFNNSNNNAVSVAVGNAQDGYVNVYNSSGSYTINLSGQSGVVTCVSVNQTSSRKVKENIKPIEDAARILELQAVCFDFKDKAQGVNKRGFIAEDVAEILPGLVTPETEDTPAALDYVGMIPYLQSIIKDHEKRIAELEETIKELKARS